MNQCPLILRDVDRELKSYESNEHLGHGRVTRIKSLPISNCSDLAVLKPNTGRGSCHIEISNVGFD